MPCARAAWSTAFGSLLLITVFLAACDPAPPLRLPDDPSKAPKTGAQLYAELCARCHGLEGDGKGETPLATPARDFKSGGFAFGNTREALGKVIAQGMPGKSPMPGFAALLKKDEQERIIDHLLTLVPVKKEADAKQMALEPTDRPVIVRGALPPIKKEMSEHPRGLMIGFPGGMSFEFDVESPRLLKARMGGFVERRDWGGRGGAPLKPLGVPFYESAKGSPGAFTFAEREGDNGVRFKSSFVEGDIAGLEWSVKGADNVIDVRETIAPAQTSHGPAFTRKWTITGKRTGPWVITLDHYSDAELLNPLIKDAPSKTGEGKAEYWVRRNPKGEISVVYWNRSKTRIDASHWPMEGCVLVIPEGEEACEFEFLVTPLDNADAKILEDLKKEIIR